MFKQVKSACEKMKKNKKESLTKNHTGKKFPPQT
jgi:hypothetical protein